MAMSDRRKYLVTRIAALVKNLETAPENFTMDKVLERLVMQLEKSFKHHAKVIDYRQAKAAPAEPEKPAKKTRAKKVAKPEVQEEAEAPAPEAEGGE